MGWPEQAPVTAISARSSHLIERIAPLGWWEEAANISGSVADQGDELGEDYRGWPLRQRLELLAFDARLAGVPLGAAGGALGGNRRAPARAETLPAPPLSATPHRALRQR
jgi:hypothetical protein